MHQPLVWPRIVVFDGFCLLCNRSVDFLIRKDKKGLLKFAALQSETARKLLPANLIRTPDFETVIYIRKNKIYTRSSAIFRIMSDLTFPWNLFGVFLIIPPKLRNVIYDFIATNRYKWFGKLASCRIPEDSPESRILS